MKFGYFTLSDNNYLDNKRDANQFTQDIVSEAIYADKLGMHSVWIGEHHFNPLGIVSCPDLLLASIAAQTKHVRLAPGVNVLPIHHPIRVAEQWATLDLLSNGRVDFATGRGYHENEYVPFGISFSDNLSIFEEGLDVLSKLWSAEGRVTHHGKHYKFDDVRINPKPVQKRIPIYVASFSKPSIDLAAKAGHGLAVAPFAAAMSFGGLKQVADLYKDLAQITDTSRAAWSAAILFTLPTMRLKSWCSVSGKSVISKNAFSRLFRKIPKTRRRAIVTSSTL